MRIRASGVLIIISYKFYQIRSGFCELLKVSPKFCPFAVENRGTFYFLLSFFLWTLKIRHINRVTL